MTVQAELSSEISRNAPTHSAIIRRLLTALNRIIDRFPGQKQQVTQLAIDGLAAAFAVLLAYEMHSDFTVWPSDTSPIWIVVLVMFIARPAALGMVTRYRARWCEVCIGDIADISAASLLPSVLVGILCVLARQSRAVVSSGVLAIELPLFIGMAAGIRCLRRAAYEVAHEEELCSRMAQPVVKASVNRIPPPDVLSQLLRLKDANLPIPTWDEQSVEAYRGRVALVTGAGGSIGFRLSRKLSHLPISRLLLLDIDETAIFEVDRELEDNSVERVPIVGDVRNRDFLRGVFRQHRPDIVLHAAAYKHVPLMEANASAAVLNNVIATRNLIDAVLEATCERFLLISTDKAVEPASVMGATKRLAELLVQSRAVQSASTRFACVRFGNVYGSRGSVVPIFLRQIQQGKPVTLTDPRMRRYFMTDKQAADLALLACTLGERGEIYVLKTGEPINIRDLATCLAESAGRSAELSFEITGIRDGEKLQERLWEPHAEVLPTRFPGICVIEPSELPDGIEESISDLECLAVGSRDFEIIAKLQSLPTGRRQFMCPQS